MLQQLKQQEAAEEVIGACEKHNFRLLRQLRGRYCGSCPHHVSLRQESLQPKIGCADCLCVSIVNAPPIMWILHMQGFADSNDRLSCGMQTGGLQCKHCVIVVVLCERQNCCTKAIGHTRVRLSPEPGALCTGLQPRQLANAPLKLAVFTLFLGA